jgi:hypothetical protein
MTISDDLYGIDRQFAFHIDEAEKLAKAAKAKGGKLDPAVKAKIDGHINAATEAKEWAAVADEIEQMRGGPGVTHPATSDGLGSKLIRAGFDLKSNPSVSFSAFDVFGGKTATLPAATVIAPTSPFIVPLGRDTRFLWPNLVRQDAGEATAISDFKQTVRTVTGTIERAITATTDKAELNVTLTHVVEAMKQVAVTISDIPNALLDAAPLRDYFNGEGRFVIDQALDAHVIAQIVAAAPPFGQTGANLVERVRNAVTSMRAEGANPPLLVLNAADAATLDLTADAGGYVFPLRDTGASPLWGLRVIERPGTTPPYVIDPQMLGVLYLGAMSFDADPYTGFKKNLTTLRVEAAALYHVRNAFGARRVAAS